MPPEAYCGSRGAGVYVASEVHRILWHRMTKPGAPLLIYVQGSHGVADVVHDNEALDLKALTRAGFIVALCDLGQTNSQGTFGNDLAKTRIGQLRTFCTGPTAPLQASPGPMGMFGGSGGAAGMLNYARANPALVGAVTGVGPLVDLEDLYENRLPFSGVTQAEVDAAYSPNGVAANYATHNPSATGNQAALAEIPMKFWYSSDDPAIPPATVESYRDLVIATGGSCELQSLGAVGHTDQGLSYEGIDTGDVADFLLAAL